MKKYLSLLALWTLMQAVAQAATGTVTLAWDASPGTNIIAAYKVYYGVAGRMYTNVLSAGTKLTLSVSNLVVGQTYYFAATAVDTSGQESDYSNEVSTLIAPPAPSKPMPPTNVRKVAGLWRFLREWFHT